MRQLYVQIPMASKMLERTFCMPVKCDAVLFSLPHAPVCHSSVVLCNSCVICSRYSCIVIRHEYLLQIFGANAIADNGLQYASAM